MRRQVASNLAWMLTERGLQVAGGIGIVAMLARGLGPEGFAHFQYAQAVVYIAASVALICGGEVVIPRLVANTDPVAQHRLVVHAFGLRFGAGVLAYLMIGAFMLVTGQGPETWLPALILGIAVLLREPSGIVTAWMQSHTRTRPNAVINISSLIVKALASGHCSGWAARACRSMRSRSRSSQCSRQYCWRCSTCPAHRRRALRPTLGWQRTCSAMARSSG